ncbi:MAG: hypothetical protein AAFV80_19630 [Bacteroidota bacterium]
MKNLNLLFVWLLIGGMIALSTNISAQNQSVSEKDTEVKIINWLSGAGQSLTAVKVNQSFKLRMMPANDSDAQIWYVHEVDAEKEVFFLWNKMIGRKHIVSISPGEGKGFQLKMIPETRAGEYGLFKMDITGNGAEGAMGYIHLDVEPGRVFINKEVNGESVVKLAPKKDHLNSDAILWSILYKNAISEE